MKILYVVHYFLPRHQAGTEIYTALLAREFRKRGCEVMVFTSEDGVPPTPPFSLEEDDWEGIPVFRLVRGEPPDFERSYSDPDVDEIFRSFLATHRPDAVHFQHAFRLSAGMIEECGRAKIPAIVTLADFWFICPPILLLRPGFELCPGPDPDGCARCGNAIGALYAGNPGSSLQASDNPLAGKTGEIIQRTTGRVIGAAHAIKRKLPQAMVQRARKWKQERDLKNPGSDFHRRQQMTAVRQRVMTRALASAALVIAPSEFLRQKTIAAGVVTPEKIIHSDYGFDHAPFQNLERTESETLRFGFIGTPVEHKGVHVAVQAMNRLAGENAELLIHGDLAWFPAYARRLRRLSKNPRTRFRGRFDNQDAASVLAAIDVLVVPSLWYENSPLTIHEAFMAGTVVIASDLGGMAELVARGGGRVFKAGDPENLASVMRALVRDPSELERLRESIPPVKTIQQNADELTSIYSRRT